MVNDASRRSHDFKDELRGKPEWVGVYCERALKPHPSWKGLSGKAKVKTGIGKSDLPGLQGGPRKRDLSAITWCARLGSIPTQCRLPSWHCSDIRRRGGRPNRRKPGCKRPRWLDASPVSSDRRASKTTGRSESE